MSTTSETVDATCPAPVEMEIKPEPETSSGDTPGHDLPMAARIEALLLSSDRPLPEPRLGELLGLSGAGTAKAIRDTIEELNSHYAKSDRSFRIEKLAGGWQILTLPQFGSLLARLHTERQSSRLSQAALETLSITAYRQPIIRAEIEAIRGVACGEVLRGLLERRLLKIVGRSEELGRPMLYGTTKEFLKIFGLSKIEDLPDVEGLSPPTRKPPKADKKKPSEEPQAETDGESSDVVVVDESSDPPSPDSEDAQVPSEE